jgi:anti-sigma factor RsiW
MMQSRDERELMRLLHGELSPERAAALRRRLHREPGLAAAYRRLKVTWDGLQLPPAAELPPGFARRIAAHAVAAGGALSWRTSPAWARLGAALALATGLAVGIGLGSWQAPQGGDSLVLIEEPEGLAESYWQALAGDDAAGSAAVEVGEAEPGSET